MAPMPSKTSARKQRELAAREELILDTARRLLLDEGYFGFGMDRLAEETEYSKGTVYQHFKSKEDVLAALAERAVATQVALFERAATFRGRTRERIQAIGLAVEIFVRLHPLHFQTEQILHAAAMQGKTEFLRHERKQATDARCMAIVEGVVRDAIAEGDLVLRAGVTTAHVVFALWAASLGAHKLIQSGLPLEKLGIERAPEALNSTYDAILDGFGWAPTSREWDYAASAQRAAREVFPDECGSLD